MGVLSALWGDFRGVAALVAFVLAKIVIPKTSSDQRLVWPVWLSPVNKFRTVWAICSP